MIGHAFRVRAYWFPQNLLEDGYPWYWFLLQNRESGRIEFRKVAKRGGEAAREFVAETKIDNEHRGVLIRLKNQGFRRYSPGENWKSMPHMRGVNPHCEMVGSYIQAKNEAVEEATNEKEANFECVEKDDPVEKKSDRLSRLRAFSEMIVDKVGTKSKWYRRQERFLATYIRTTDGIYRSRWIRAWSLRDAYIKFAKFID